MIFYQSLRNVEDLDPDPFISRCGSRIRIKMKWILSTEYNFLSTLPPFPANNLIMLLLQNSIFIVKQMTFLFFFALSIVKKTFK